MLRKARILVIDDEEDICHFSKSILEKTGKFEVLASTDALTGINLAKNHRPDLILLDINMPKMDGGAVAQNLLENKSTSEIPIVFLTALLRKAEVEENTGKIGGHFFIAKPVDPKELIKKIELILKIED
jgi:CheY-like chemotaxis protein